MLVYFRKVRNISFCISFRPYYCRSYQFQGVSVVLKQLISVI
ncbi:nuclear poly(A) polymerase 3 isoform X1 [Iris pallida]|nr:nuclear poly(A) polymerase 3 isoform X1 [Iris pallida]